MKEMCKIECVERRIQQKISRPLTEHGNQRISNNKEIQVLYKDLDVVVVVLVVVIDINRKSLEWLGHLIRME